MSHRLTRRVRQLTSAAALLAAASSISTTASASAVVLPPSPCVSSVVRCVLHGAPPVSVPVLRDPIVHCDATCGDPATPLRRD